jgi:heme exporter protein C
MTMLRYAHPQRFFAASGRLVPWLAVAAALGLASGLYQALTVPPDYRQGEAVRILFLHVPAVWTAMLAYGAMTLFSAAGLIWRLPLAGMAAKAAAPLGAMFTALGLITGSLWGRPAWGAWWVWDGRLTSFLLLLFLYLGIMALSDAIEDETRAARASAILTVVGAVNLPVIHFSVTWWATLHQGESLMRGGGSGLSPVYLPPLLTMVAAYTLLFAVLWLVRLRSEILRRGAP